MNASAGDVGAAVPATQRAINLLAETNATPAAESLRRRLQEDLRRYRQRGKSC